MTLQSRINEWKLPLSEEGRNLLVMLQVRVEQKIETCSQSESEDDNEIKKT